MIKRLFQLIIMLIPVTLFAWLLVIDIAPSGVLEARGDVGVRSPYLDRLLPDERVLPLQSTPGGEQYTTVIDDPTYFSVHFPNTRFDTIELDVWFKNSGQPIVEVGGLVDIFSQAYDLRPLQNLIIDNLSWNQLSGDDVRLLQRHEDYVSVDAFLADPPERSRIATYHYDFDAPYRLPFYTSTGRDQQIDVSLRGFHKFVTYVKDEPMAIVLTYMDMNRTTGADEVRVTVRNESKEIVWEQKVNDDGNETENQISSTHEVIVKVNDLPEGVYSVDLSGTSDVFWRNITTNLRYVTFVNQIYIGDDVGHKPEPRGTRFFTNAKHFTFETLHADATQRIGLGDQEVQLAKTHEKVRVSIEDAGVVTGNTPVGDVKIVGDGKFAFSPDAFFDPDPVRIGPLTDLDALGIDYVLTSYEAPRQEGEWFVGTAEFAIADIVTEENDATFTLSAPLIAEEQHTIDVRAMHMRFEKDPLNAKGFLRALRDRLPFGL